MLETIVELAEKRGFPPTIRELGDELDISSTNGVTDHLKVLCRKRFATRVEMITRSLLVTDLGRAAMKRAQEALGE